MLKPTFDQSRYKCSTNKSSQTEKSAKEMKILFYFSQTIPF